MPVATNKNRTYIPNTAKRYYSSAEEVNDRRFQCLIYHWAQDEHEAFTEEQLARITDMDPKRKVVTALTISEMVDYLTSGVGFDIVRDDDVVEIYEVLLDYIELVGSAQNVELGKKVIEMVTEFRTELERVIRRVHPTYLKDRGPKEDIFTRMKRRST